jgi:hypothetical protein
VEVQGFVYANPERERIPARPSTSLMHKSDRFQGVGQCGTILQVIVHSLLHEGVDGAAYEELLVPQGDDKRALILSQEGKTSTKDGPCRAATERYKCSTALPFASL